MARPNRKWVFKNDPAHEWIVKTWWLAPFFTPSWSDLVRPSMSFFTSETESLKQIRGWPCQARP
jgi:hypothetical protein